MKFFVRDLSGHSLPIEASTVSDLQFAVADRTAIPVEEQRLVYGNRQLVNGRLSEYGAAVRIVGDCSLCNTSFCSMHRLSEDHKCPGLSTARADAFQKNKTKLESERTTTEKLASF